MMFSLHVVELANHDAIHDGLAQNARVLLHQLPQPQVAQTVVGGRTISSADKWQ